MQNRNVVYDVTKFFESDQEELVEVMVFADEFAAELFCESVNWANTATGNVDYFITNMQMVNEITW